MEERSKKIRLGLILQECVEAALKLTSYNSFSATPKYDPDAMTPDFLIPNSTSPKFFVEVTQTEARDSFRMKILRYFEAVCDAKAHFGNEVISVNILLGDPSKELPVNSVKAMYGFFDANLNPRGDAGTKQVKARLFRLEAEALELALDESIGDVNSAMPTVLKKHPEAIGDLGEQLQSLLDDAEAKAHLYKVWDYERDRLMKLGEVDGLMKDAPTYKRPILNSLFFSDEHFESLVSTRDPNRLPDEIKTQLVTCKLATARKVIGGERLELESSFWEFIRNSKVARKLRKICSDVIETDLAMNFFFQDIRKLERRKAMASVFLEKIRNGQLQAAIAENLVCDSCFGLEHRRCWILDLATRAIGISNGRLSRLVYQSGRNPGNIGDPISHLAPKTDRARGLPESALIEYAAVTSESILKIAQDNAIDFFSLTPTELASRLLALRLDGAIKLHKLNPLHLIIQNIAEEQGAKVHYGLIDNLISDLTSDNAATGRFKIFTVSKGGKEVLVNALYVDDYGGLDKAKEWASRGRSFMYRFGEDSGIQKRRRTLLFVADGSWKPESIRKLRAAGWKVIRLSEFGSTLEALLGGS
jgi:hypothetical protein